MLSSICPTVPGSSLESKSYSESLNPSIPSFYLCLPSVCLQVCRGAISNLPAFTLNTFMKTRLVTLFLLLSLALCFGQGPSCTFKGSFTVATTGVPYNNSTANPNCNSFTLTWNSAGFSALSIQLEGSDDNVTYAAFSGASTVLVGANPSTTLSGAIVIQASSTLAYLRVNLVSKTGTGTLNYQVYGYSGVTPTAKKGGGGSVNSVTASSPLNSSGGSDPNITVASATGSGPVVEQVSPVLENPSLGVNTLTQTWTAGAGGVAANQLVCVSKSGSPATAITCPITVVTTEINASVLGIAAASATAGNPVEIIVRGPASCTFDSVNSPVAGHIAQISLATPGYCQDSGSFTANFGVPIVGVVTATGGTSIYVSGSSLFGSQITTVSPLQITNPSSGTQFQIKAGNATAAMGTGTKLAFATGSFVGGDCLQVDTVTGSIIDAGSACSGSAAPAFGSIISGTNTTATMQVGAGAVIEPTATSPGGIYATQMVDGNDLTALSVTTPGGPSVDHVDVAPASAANPATVTVSGKGTDSNINLNLVSKGVGTVQVNGSAIAVSPLTTKGDIWGYGSSDGRIPACPNNYTLIYDSSSPLGVHCIQYVSYLLSNGLIAQTGPGTTANRVITNTDGLVSITKGDGVSGNPIINIASVQGNGAKVQLSGGATTLNDCVKFDANGNTVDAGSPCGSGGGGSGGGITVYSGLTTSFVSTFFLPVGGGAAAALTEATAQTVAPSAATISNFHVQISQALGVGNSAVFTWRDSGVSQTLTCTISGASATSCVDTTHSFNAAAGDLLDIQVMPSGTIVVTPTIIASAAFGTSGVGVTSVTGSSPLLSTGGTTPALSCPTCITGSPINHGVSLGSATQAASYTGTGTAGQVLTSNGPSADPTFQAAGGGGVTYTAPPTTGWTWVNQGSATVVNASFGAQMTLPNAGLNWRLQVRPVTAPFSLTTYMRMISFSMGSSYDTGIYLYDSVSGKIMGLENLIQTNVSVMRVEKITNATTDASTAYSSAPGLFLAAGAWARIRDDSTTLYFDISIDGINFYTLFSEPVGTFITPNYVGWGGVNAYSVFEFGQLLSWAGVP